MDFKLPLFKLYQRQSANGRTYFTGRFGDAKVLVFREDDVEEDALYGAQARWTVFAAPPAEQTRERIDGRQRSPLRLFQGEN
jgi:hypothetical protein